jgi:hypothetical protein
MRLRKKEEDLVEVEGALIACSCDTIHPGYLNFKSEDDCECELWAAEEPLGKFTKSQVSVSYRRKK